MKVDLFLKNSKTLFKELNKLRIVIGNQSADLDSIVSAISLAFYLNNASPKPSSNFIPIINSTKSIIQTKKQCTYLFKQLAVDIDDLVYISDLKRENLEDVILVDHNQLDGQEKSLDFEELISGVVDHHLDKQNFLNVKPRIIDTRVGSNASLIVDMFSRSEIKLDESFANMILFPILTDTNNLTQRTHQIDIDAVAYLKKFTNVDLKQLYSKLDELKFSVDGSESVEELLRQDYKEYENKWAMSSVTFSLVKWIEESEHLKECVKFIEDNGLFFYGILSCFKVESEKHERDLVLFGDESVIKKFIGVDQPNLTFISNSLYDKDQCKAYAVFKVRDVTLTRKYWQPVLEKFLKDFKIIN